MYIEWPNNESNSSEFLLKYLTQKYFKNKKQIELTQRQSLFDSFL